MKFVPLARVADVQLGKMLSPKAKTGSHYYPYLRNTNVQWGRIAVTDIAQMDFTEAEREKFALRIGDLLVCEGGEPGRCAVWKNELPGCYYQKALHRVRPHEGKADAEFLSLWIRHQASTGAFKDQNAKTTIAHLPQVRLEQLQVPDLCHAEQLRIAARLSAQLTEVSAAGKAAEAQAEAISVLRDRMLADVFFAAKSAPTRRVGDHALTTSGSTPKRGVAAYWSPAEVPWVKTGEIDFAPIRQIGESVSRKALSECSLALLPPKTVLIAITGEGKTRGRSAVLEVEATTNQHSVAILPNEIWDPYFLQLWLQASYQDLRELSAGRGGSRSALSGIQIKALEVPSPSREMQQTIVRRAQEALREVDALAAANNSQREELARLPQRLLAQAFAH